MGYPHAAENAAAPILCHHKSPGHWLLARAGKRVLRPGGVELTDELLRHLEIGPKDTVIELAPGLGHTAAKVLARKPLSYLGVDREATVVQALERKLGCDRVRIVQGSAEDTGLPGGTATVLFGEAMLTMQSYKRRSDVVSEAWRILRRGGRYGIHELCVTDVSNAFRNRLQADLCSAIRHSVSLLTVTEWRELLESAGFSTRVKRTAPMRLLEPSRIVRDEGVLGAARFAFNAVTSPSILRRVVEMRRVFRRYEENLQTIAMVCDKEY